MAVNAGELRHQMRVHGLRGAELARRANVSPATISHALNGRRIHPAKFRKIATELHRAEPMPGVEMPIQRDGTADDAGGGVRS
ncbi:MAG TPA: helix-turn-helix transcriptional regulator [Candidatus Dormibacteraeota bacterium]|nr:helix-turn-helix transcriptional regulator [Candidatus Dormibacteraeota bacterium]